MMDWRSEMQAETAGIALEVAQGDFGELVTYQHRNDTPIQIYVIPQRESNARARNWGHTRARELPATFVAPMQLDVLGSGTQFPPVEMPMVDDTITDENGFIYSIREWKADDLDAVFTFDDCICTKVKAVGAIGS